MYVGGPHAYNDPPRGIGPVPMGNTGRAAGLSQAPGPQIQLLCTVATAPWKEIGREPATGDKPVRPEGLKLGHTLKSNAQDAPKTKEGRVSGGGALASAFF